MKQARSAIVRGTLLSSVLLACARPAPPQPAHGSSLSQPVPAPQVAAAGPDARALWTQAQAVFERRCVVCHGCYDAPCQLKLEAFEGIARGASAERVYDAARLTAAEPTRLFIDAHTPESWRKKGFHSVLAVEGSARAARASALVRMLELKRAHPLPTRANIADEFTLDLDREQTCATAEGFDAFAKAHPLWGMPYALPALSDAEHTALLAWVDAGAPYPGPAALAPPIERAIERWEAFLNEPSAKSRLVARYLYEHLFLAGLYFEDIDTDTFFRLVRSRTPAGAAVDEIATRRPFDDPGAGPLHYRFVRREGRPLAKTHMPYALSDARLQRYRELFIEPEYEVDRLPTYAPEIAANPFLAFRALPPESRYRFMLDEAQFTMMGFIKGPVCRGQVALNVIQERFWITFVDPDSAWAAAEARLLAAHPDNLALPAEGSSDDLPTRGYQYSRKRASYVQKRSKLVHDLGRRGHALELATIWDGDGKNQNAALTVFRHFDSATVVKGLVGGPPKTAWVVGYALLESIHYLLVAGFDVFGNVGHQINTRLYMDFLRMEGEANLLHLLPLARRRPLIDTWYRGADSETTTQLYRELTSFADLPKIRYQTRTPERELFGMLEARLEPVRSRAYDLDRIENDSLREALQRLASVNGRAASQLPEISFVAVTDGNGEATYFTILRDSAHTNVAQLFDEASRRVPVEDRLSIARGLLGAYPNAFFLVPRQELESFIDAVSVLDGKSAYAALRARFGMLRTSAHFWDFSDRMQAEHNRRNPLESGLLDYNRLDAF